MTDRAAPRTEADWKWLREQMSHEALSRLLPVVPMSDYEIAGAVWRDSETKDTLTDIAAYDRRGLLNVIGALIEREATPSPSAEVLGPQSIEGYEPAVDDFGNQYLSPLASPAATPDLPPLPTFEPATPEGLAGIVKEQAGAPAATPDLRAALERIRDHFPYPGDAAPAATPDLRREVREFAVAMEERLTANDHKGGWDDSESDWLMDRLREEADELEAALIRSPLDPNEVRREAADVANFALMLQDNASANGVDAQLTRLAAPAATAGLPDVERLEEALLATEDPHDVPSWTRRAAAEYARLSSSEKVSGS
jgi:hypothetical protein